MRAEFYSEISRRLAQMRASGPTATERVLDSPQGPQVAWLDGEGGIRRALNFCSNNYLGLAGDPRVAAAAREAIDRWGAGVASVRFICGTQSIHVALETAIADYVGCEDALVFAACFDANGGVFEPLLGADDIVLSADLNHASIIDGLRLCAAQRRRYRAGDLEDLETQLRAARAGGARRLMIATDGVFSMDGDIAPLREITALAERYEALTMVDDCHATGVLGPRGRGTAAELAAGRVDIVTGTFGKALGGGMGGFIAARRGVIALLRRTSRPYLFSNALAPSLCASALAAISISNSEEGDGLRTRLFENATRLRDGLMGVGLDLLPGVHPITPVMLGEGARAQAMAGALLERGILATAFAFPVVPRGAARLRIQPSAAHSADEIDAAIAAFAEVHAGMDPAA